MQAGPRNGNTTSIYKNLLSQQVEIEKYRNNASKWHNRALGSGAVSVLSFFGMMASGDPTGLYISAVSLILAIGSEITAQVNKASANGLSTPFTNQLKGLEMAGTGVYRTVREEKAEAHAAQQLHPAQHMDVSTSLGFQPAN